MNCIILIIYYNVHTIYLPALIKLKVFLKINAIINPFVVESLKFSNTLHEE